PGIAFGVSHSFQFIAGSAGAVVLGDVHRRWFRCDFFAGRHAHLSFGSHCDGGGNRVRLVVRRPGTGASGVWPLGGSSMVRNNLRNNEPAADPRHFVVVLAKPERRSVAGAKTPLVGAVYDRASFVESRNTRGHRPRLQFPDLDPGPTLEGLHGFGHIGVGTFT